MIADHEIDLAGFQGSQLGVAMPRLPQRWRAFEERAAVGHLLRGQDQTARAHLQRDVDPGTARRRARIGSAIRRSDSATSGDSARPESTRKHLKPSPPASSKGSISIALPRTIPPQNPTSL